MIELLRLDFMQYALVAALFTGLTGLGFGVIPAMRASGKAAFGSLRAGRSGTTRQRFRSVLVAIERQSYHDEVTGIRGSEPAPAESTIGHEASSTSAWFPAKVRTGPTQHH